MKIKSYQDARGQWRWSAVDRNGRIIADGSEGYDSADSLRRAIKNVIGEFRQEISMNGEHENKVVRLFAKAVDEPA